MKLYVLITAFFLVIGIQPATAVHAVAGGSGESYSSFIPEGWAVFKSRYSHAKGIVKGDLNGDGVPDLTMILVKLDKNGEEPEFGTRKLVLLFGEKSGGYRLAGGSNKILLCRHYGKQFHDPLDSIKINRKTIVIKQIGKDEEIIRIWTHKWQFRNNDWYLIGKAIDRYLVTDGSHRGKEFNLITGNIIGTDKLPNSPVIKSTIKVPSLTPLKMDKYDFDANEMFWPWG